LHNPPEYTDFCERYLNFIPEPISRHGNSLHLVPPDFPDLGGLRVLRAGLYLGEVLTKRFEPSQAFAMALEPASAKNRVNFSITDGDLYRYLKGESFELSASETMPVEIADGWNLITVNNFPLGWAKVTGGRLKNKYPKGWLMA
jgi:NOL1/NOP2/fmu family ribosome biogenesis protein